MNENIPLKGKKKTANFITSTKKIPFACKYKNALIDALTHQPDCDLIFSKDVYQHLFSSKDSNLL